MCKFTCPEEHESDVGLILLSFWPITEKLAALLSLFDIWDKRGGETLNFRRKMNENSEAKF